MSRIVSVLVGFVSIVSVAPAQGQQPAAPVDKWAPLRFLIGTWDGASTGRPGKGTVHREYRLVLRDQFIEVRNTSTYLPQEKNPKGEVHEDIGYISWDRGRQVFVFRQFHVEGFVTTYVTTANPVAPIVFTSESIENIPPGWRARETYTVSDGELVESFELAEAGKEFTQYSVARLRRSR
jgi:hypothetical protein